MTLYKEIYKILVSLRPKKSSGHDNISTYFLKKISQTISYPISILINKSFTEGIVPESLKIAKVIPIHKGKERESFSNYRPISILPSLSKILEKAMYKRVYNFLENNNILYKSQYGFRKNHSTTEAILEFLSNTVDSQQLVYFLIYPKLSTQSIRKYYYINLIIMVSVVMHSNG